MSTTALPAALHDGTAASTARIGPNAVTRLAEALGEIGDGARARQAVFAISGLGRYLSVPPADMVDECEVIALHGALRRVLDADTSERVVWRAGELTGDYLLEHRIPPAARRLLSLLPRAISSRLLLAAMARNAWTFAGSGEFGFEAGNPTRLTLTDCPLCRHEPASRPQCTYYAATFHRLFQVLVSPKVEVENVGCRALGDGVCEMVVRW